MFYANVPTVGYPPVRICGNHFPDDSERVFQGRQGLAVRESAFLAGGKRHAICQAMFLAGQRRIMRNDITICYEDCTGTLLIQRNDITPIEADAELDDNEMIVVTDSATGAVVSVTVPFVKSFWRAHIPELVGNISVYLPVEESDIRRAIPPNLADTQSSLHRDCQGI